MLQLSAGEVLNYTYAFAVRHMNREEREELDEMLRPVKVDVENLLPPRLRGMKPPPGWRPVKDPFRGR